MPEAVRLLEARVVDQIAAGEVVERPASVVKELVENALDAGAKAIDIVLKDGGRSLVRIADDGHGMDREDAMLAIERHATSKIRDVEDLQGIGTLGFRGEALPSIAAVSRFELVTRTADGEGTRIRIDAGTLQDVRDVGAAKGTVVDVRTLFHTLPARRAFLRSAATEVSHCTEVVTRLALARPDVAFTVRHEERVGIRTPSTTDLAVRAADLLGPDAGKLVPVDVESPAGLRLVGLAATAGIHRGSVGTALYLYVDGRWVRDTVLRRAISHAYRDLVPEGRHPLVVLDLRVPAGAADVNVHPTKAEVRFRDPSGVAAFVGERLRELIRSDVRRAGLRPVALGAVSLPFRSELPPAAPPVAPVRPSISAMPPELLLVHEPPPVRAVPAARALAVARGRYLVIDDGRGLAVVDGGRLARRVAIAGPLGEARRLMVPCRVTVTADRMSALEAGEDELGALGVTFVRFSATEVVVRTVPDVLSDADPAEVLRIAAGALGGDVLEAWGEGLSPAEVLPDGLLGRAAALGIAVGPIVGHVALGGE